jgi:Polyketide cyclase / dehydrase and lipid transport
MMARYVTTVSSTMSPIAAFAYLVDFASVAQWDPGVTKATLSDGVTGAVAARYDVTSRFLWRSLPLEYEILRSVPPTDSKDGIVVLRADTDDLTSLDTITVTAATGGSDGGSEVTYDAVVTLKGPRRVFDPAMAAALFVIGRRAEAGLRRALSPVPSASS